MSGTTIFEWPDLKALIKWLIFAWIFLPIMAIAFLGCVALVFATHGHPFLAVTQAAIGLGQEYQATSDPNAFTHAVCVPSLPPMGAASPLAPTLVPIPNDQCRIESITTTQIAGQLRRDFWIAFRSLAIAFSIPICLVYAVTFAGNFFSRFEAKPGFRYATPRQDWCSMVRAKRRFLGPSSDFGGLVVGKAVDAGQVGKRRRWFGRSTWTAPLLIDPCRAGPTHSFIISGDRKFGIASAITTLRHWHGPAVVFDPSGELAPSACAARKQMGQKIYHLRPANDTGFNALAWINTNSAWWEYDVEALGEWICGASRNSDTVRGIIYDETVEDHARKLICCLIAHLLCDPVALGPIKNLHTIRQAITLPVDQIENILDGIYEQSESSYVRATASGLGLLSTDEFVRVVEKARSLTAWLENDKLARLVCGDGLSKAEFLQGRSTIFISIPHEDLESAPGLARIVVGSLLQASYHHDGISNGRILYLIDEAVRLGNMRLLETMRDAGRSYGITMQLFYRSSAEIIGQWGRRGKRAWYDSLSYRSYAALADLDTAIEVEMASVTDDCRTLIQAEEVLRQSNEVFVIAVGLLPLRCAPPFEFSTDDAANTKHHFAESHFEELT
jgi:hypothetical protein